MINNLISDIAERYDSTADLEHDVQAAGGSYALAYSGSILFRTADIKGRLISSGIDPIDGKELQQYSEMMSPVIDKVIESHSLRMDLKEQIRQATNDDQRQRLISIYKEELQ